jgi:drug/metabolite transporter (DMT)-like permease
MNTAIKSALQSPMAKITSLKVVPPIDSTTPSSCRSPTLSLTGSVTTAILILISVLLQSGTSSVTAFSQSAALSFRIGEHHSTLIHSSLIQSYFSAKRPSTARAARSTYTSTSKKKSNVKPKIHRSGKTNALDGVHSTDRFQNVPNPESFDPLHLSTSSSTRSIGYAQHTTPSTKDDHSDPSASTATTSKPFGILNEIWRARFLLLVAAGLYGTNFTIVKILNDQMPFGASTSLRFTLATLATLPFLFPAFSSTSIAAGAAVGAASASSALASWSDVLPVIITGMEVGFFNAMAYIFQAVGLQTVDASKSAFICSLAVVVVPILDFLFKKKSLSIQSIAGLLCAVVGVGLLELSGTNLSLTPGDFFTFAQPLFFGIGIWKMEEAMHKYPMEAKRITASQVLMVAICSVVNCFLIQPHFGTGCPPPSLDQIISWITEPKVLAALVWTGVVTTALTQYLETVSLKTLSASEATLWFSTEPLWGAGFASAVAGERLGINAMYGAGLILSGCAISTTQKNEEVVNTKASSISANGTAAPQEEEGLASLTPYLASLALQAQVAEGCLKEAILESEEFLHAENTACNAVANVVSDSISTHVIEESVGQLPTLVDTLLK